MKKFSIILWQLYEKPEVIVARELYDHKDSKIAAINLVSKKYASKLKEMDGLMNAELKNQLRAYR